MNETFHISDLIAKNPKNIISNFSSSFTQTKLDIGYEKTIRTLVRHKDSKRETKKEREKRERTKEKREKEKT